MTEESPNAVFDRIAKDISAKFIYQQVVRKMRAATVSQPATARVSAAS